jgi:hypothetical protein
MRGFRGYDDWIFGLGENQFDKSEECIDELNCECDDCTCSRNLADLEEYGDYLYEQEKDKRLGL